MQAYDALHDAFEPPEPIGRRRRFRAFGAPREQPEPLLNNSEAAKQTAPKQGVPKRKATNKAQQTKAQQQSKLASKLSKATKPQKDTSVHPNVDATKDLEQDGKTYPEDGGWTVLYETPMPESGLQSHLMSWMRKRRKRRITP